MLVHCNEPLCVLRKHTQSSTLITQEEIGYSSSPKQEQWKERGICKFLHPLMKHNLLGRWVFCLRTLIDMSSIMIEWVRSKSLEEMPQPRKMRLKWYTGWMVIRQLSGHTVGHVATDYLYVKQLKRRFGTSCTVHIVLSATHHLIIFMAVLYEIENFPHHPSVW